MEQALRELIKRYRSASDCGCNYQCSCGHIECRDVATALEKLLPKEGTMITAEEARRRINDKTKIQAKAWLEDAEVKITKAIANNLYYCQHTYHEGLFEIVKAELLKFGYSVSKQSAGCGGIDSVSISWKN